MIHKISSFILLYFFLLCYSLFNYIQLLTKMQVIFCKIFLQIPFILLQNFLYFSLSLSTHDNPF
nr:MAG TPA: hypothetical protein [Caudoviricetes sp.]